MNCSVRRAVFALVLSLVAVLPAFTQVGTSQFQGRVTDPQQGVVAGAQVRIVNQATGIERKLTTNNAGLYTAPFLSPGRYVITVQASGFSTATSEPLIVNVGQTLAFDVELKVGNTSEQVTVTASSPMVNTTDGSLSTVIDQKFVDNMPLNGRSVQDLISLTPGVTTSSPLETSTLGVTGDFSINGQRTEANGYVVDGVSANFSSGSGLLSNAPGIVPAVTALGTSQALASIDDIQEFRVLSSSYSAEFGRAAGGQVTFATRSGTNDLHGTLFEYLRNDKFDANNWFNDYLRQRKPPLRQNDFGGTIGGPVWIPRLYHGKDKTFFFVSYEGLRLIQPVAASVVGVPDANLRANADPAIRPILNAYPLPNGPEQLLPCSGTTFSNATPWPCPSGAATATLVPSGVATFTSSYSLPNQLNATSVRLDQKITSKMSGFFRFSDTPSSTQSRQVYSIVTAFTSNTRTYTAGLTNQISSNMINNFRLGYGRNSMYHDGYLDSFGGATPLDLKGAFGISGYANPEPDVLLQFAGTNTTAFFIRNDTNLSTQWNPVDTLSLTKGHHQLKFGFDYRRVSSSVAGYNPLVQVFYNSVWQLQNNLAGQYNIIEDQAGQPLFNQYALFAQDEWRVAPRLSLSLGLRWDVDGPPTSANGKDAFTLRGDLSNPASLALAPRGTPLWKTSYFNFAPRLGVAYQLRTKQGWETVLRTGGGVFFDTDNWLGSAAYQGLGFQGSSSCPALTCGVPPSKAVLDAGAPPTVAPYTSATVYYFPTHMQLPYSLQWNVSVQQSLGVPQSITLSYVGAVGRRLPNIQQFAVSSQNPNFNVIDSAYGGIHSNYNALQASFQRRLSRGVQVQASYAWAHMLDNTSEGITNIGARIFPPKYGDSDLDLRHNFVMGTSWDVPGVNHNSLTKAVFSRWGLDGRFTARTGFPMQIFGSSSTLTDPATGQQFYSGVSLNPGVPLYLYGADCTNYYIAHGNPNNGRNCPGGRAINPTAFTATNSLYNPAPKNLTRGFGMNQINLAIRRDFSLREHLRLQFRAETYNLFNHPNFGSIGTSLNQSTFGLATNTLNSSLASTSGLYQQGGPRSMQFALKLIF